MVNFGFNSASILGILLALAGGGLYLLRSLRPEISRDHDIFFAAVGLLCGGILFFQGWRLDPILQFSQLLLAGSAVFFAFESVRLRGFATQQVRGRGATSYVDDDRPVSRVYRAELEDEAMYDEDEYEYGYQEEQVQRRRLQGSPSRSSSNRSRSGYEEENPNPRPRRSSSRNDDDYNSQPPVNNRSRRRPATRNENIDEETRPRRSSSSRDYRGYDNSTRKKPPSRNRPRSANDIASNVGTEYVDYQPLNQDEMDDRRSPEDKSDNYEY